MSYREDKIARRWKAWEAVVEWRQASSHEREDVIGELEESSREISEVQPKGAAARFVAVDLLDLFGDERVEGINETVVADVNALIAQIGKLRAISEK